MKSFFFLIFVFFIYLNACSTGKDRQAYIDDADRFCDIHKISSWERDGKLDALNRLDPTQKAAELTRAIRATIKTPEMKTIIFEKGRKLPADEFYPYLQQAIPELTGLPFDCPAIPEFYLAE